MGVFDLMEGEELDVGAVGSMPVLRTRHSAISLVGISPAQVRFFTLRLEPLYLYKYSSFIYNLRCHSTVRCADRFCSARLL